MAEQELLTSRELAHILDISQEAVIKRASRGKWPVAATGFNEKNQPVRKYNPNDLPPYIRETITQSQLDTEDEPRVETNKSEESAAIQELLRENRRLRKKLLRGQGIEDLIVEKVIDVHKSPPITRPPRPPRKLGTGGVEIPCLHLGDVHLGKVTQTYDTMVAKDRISTLSTKVVEVVNLRRNNAKIEELRIYLGGDMVEGEAGNFPSQPFHVDRSVIDQATYEGVAILESMAVYFLEHFKRLRFIGVVGNHGRGRSRNTTGHEKTNWDRVLYRILKYRLLGTENIPNKEMSKRVQFVIPDEFFAVDRVFDWGNLIVHGDQIRGQLGIPWYGVRKKIHGWSNAPEIPLWDYLFFGHYHTMGSGTENNKIWLANGSTESSNSYALESFGSSGRPCQRLCFFNRNRGLISDDPIYLVDRVPEVKRYSAH